MNELIADLTLTLSSSERLLKKSKRSDFFMLSEVEACL
jgi:hypothetical protein